MEDKFYKRVLDIMYEGIYYVDKERKITFWNRGAERITGFTANEVVGKYCHDNILNHVNSEGERLCLGGCPLHKTIEDGLHRETNVFLHHKEGYRVPVSIKVIPLYEEGIIIGALEIFTDNSKKIMLYDEIEKYKALAFKDQLTNLPNRRYIEAFIESKINEFKGFNINFGILFIDIDNFKSFNDTYGHDVGDEVLKTVAKTCNNALRNSDLIGRYGGEEFIAVLPGTDDEGLEKCAEKIRMLIENSNLRAKNKELKVTVSIGATMMKIDDTINSLLKRGDELMYKSKEQGKNKVTRDSSKIISLHEKH